MVRYSTIEKAALFVISAYLIGMILFSRNVKVDSTGSLAYSNVTPEQVHISYGDLTEHYATMLFTWSTLTEVDGCSFMLVTGRNKATAYKVDDHHAEITTDKYSNFIYKLKISKLNYNTDYTYNISCWLGSRTGTKSYNFRTPPGYAQNVTMLILADWATDHIGDLDNPQHTLTPKPDILEPLIKEEGFTSVWHLGDIAYDLFSDNGKRGDRFLRTIEPVAASIPYMIAAGNHETKKKFSHLRMRFSFPTKELWYSMKIGMAHVVVINTEYSLPENLDHLQWKHEDFLRQLKWLVRDLTQYSDVRKKYPWLIVMGHKPLYCSPNKYSEMINKVCLKQAPVIRAMFEEVFSMFKVDLYLCGHLHLYERSLPVREGEVIGDWNKDTRVFKNPSALIQVINGVAGNLEGKQVVFNITDTPEPYTAHISESLGFGKLTIHNKTHLHYEQLSFGQTQFDDMNEDLVSSRRVEDYFWIVKKDEASHS